MACFDPASRPCSGGTKQGTKAVYDAIETVWPDTTGLGTYNCRPVNHPNNSGPSVHGNGRAFDRGIPVSFRPDLGLVVAQALCDNAVALGVQFIIWNRKKWGCALMPAGARWSTWPAYGGYAHLDHVHGELNKDAAGRLTYEQALAILKTPQEDDVPTQKEWDELVEKVGKIYVGLFDKDSDDAGMANGRGDSIMNVTVAARNAARKAAEQTAEKPVTPPEPSDND